MILEIGLKVLNFEDLQANYNNIKSMDDLENHTTVIKIEDTDRFIIQDF